MQAQQIRNKTEAITYTQSLTAVQTLLKTGLGAIAYLRNLLPEENFVSSHFANAKNEADQSFELESSQENHGIRRNGNGFSVMTLARGYTDEADRLLNYLEYGIFDALQKNYLRSFIFAVYLDNKDPNNILEAYTFNFKYYTMPGSDVTIPIMSLGDSMKKMSLVGKGKDKEDPVAKALRNGKTPSLKEVKLSVKTLLKTLITAMQKMELLPRRRFASFKMFYTEETPLDYEPPYFQAADMEKDKWYFMTHDVDEVPDKYNIGKLDTGHHCINITVASITPYLPPSIDSDNETVGPSALTPMQEANWSKKQAELQIEDAVKRKVIWAAEDEVGIDADAEAEDDPDYIRQDDGTYKPITSTPVSRRFSTAPDLQGSLEEAQYGGVSEKVPTKLQEMAAGLVRGQIEETQPLLTPVKGNFDLVNKVDSLSSRDYSMHPSHPEPITLVDQNHGMELDSISEVSEERDTRVIDLRSDPAVESIQSFETSPFRENIVNMSPTVVEDDDNGSGCECAIDLEEDAILCDGGCKKWFHVWCMGYHSVKDLRIPNKFVCLDCRTRSDVNWDFIQMDIYPAMLQRFKELTLFRRAIKVAEELKSFVSSDFNKAYGSDSVTATQMVKRLEEEGIISKETAQLDDAGVNFGRSKAKAKGTSTRPRRNLQKVRYVFNFTHEKYRDYFKPNDREVEKRLLGINDLESDSQTQEETQVAGKRGHGNDAKIGRPLKKVKISVTAGVDLAE